MKKPCETCHPQCSPRTQKWWRGVWARPYLLAHVDLPCPRPCVVSVGQLSGDGCPGRTGTFLSSQLVLTESVTHAGNRMGAEVCMGGLVMAEDPVIRG